MQKTEQNLKVRRMVVTGLLIATIAVLMLTGLGFIRIGPISASLLCLPVLIGVMAEGLGVGVILGLAFGFLSFLKAFSDPTIFAPYFMNPLVSIVPRVLIPIAAWLALRILMPKRQENKRLQFFARTLACFVGAAVNTVGVLGAIYIACSWGYVVPGVSAETVGGILLGIGLANGLPEAGVMMVVAPLVMTAMDRSMHRHR